MSPASSGPLEVERYIGACLISQNRPKSGSLKNVVNRDAFYPREHLVSELYHNGYVNVNVNNRYRVQRCDSADGWAGGMPLISFANHQRRGRRPETSPSECLGNFPQRSEDQQNPLARLAVHTQGAPLILTNRFNQKKKSLKCPTNKSSSSPATTPENAAQKCNNMCVSADTVSVTSDESSASANSENCLPRIIKPRKRRKKDRKPPHLNRPLNQDGFSTDSASPDIDTPSGIVTLKPYLPFNYETYTFGLVPDTSRLSNSSSSKSALNNMYQISDSSETPKLHHTFEDIEDIDDRKDINGNQTESLCQCRYCDPSGQIWDVDRNCYSPFLTSPRHDKVFQFPEVKADKTLSKKFSVPISNSENNKCLIHSLSSVSLNEDVVEPKSSVFKPRSLRDLEVSTEIVTSLNGHRDIEIKFFSSPSIENEPAGRNTKKITFNDDGDEENSKCCSSEPNDAVSTLDCNNLPAEE